MRGIAMLEDKNVVRRLYLNCSSHALSAKRHSLPHAVPDASGKMWLLFCSLKRLM
jgi:hypothetical protein